MRRSRKCSRTRRRRCVCPALLPSGCVRAYALASWGWRRKAQREQPLLFSLSSSVCRQHAVDSLSSMPSCWHCRTPGPQPQVTLALLCGKSVPLSLMLQAGVGISRIPPCMVWRLLLRDVPLIFLYWFPAALQVLTALVRVVGDGQKSASCGPGKGSDYWSRSACPTCSI